MNTSHTLKTAITLALLAGIAAAHAAAVPSGCQRVSGEEGADEQYFGSDSQGNPIFCAAGTAQNATPLPRGSSAGAAPTTSPYNDPAQGYNDAASQSGSATGNPYGLGSGGYSQGDYGQGTAGYPAAQSGGWQGSGGQSGAGGYGGAGGGYGGASGGYGGASGGGGIQGGSFKGGGHSQGSSTGAAGSNPYASGNAFVKRPKKCKTNCPPPGAPAGQGGYGPAAGSYGDQTAYGQTGGYGDQPYGNDPAGSAGGPSSSQGDEGTAGTGAWAGASGNDHNHVPVESPPFGDAGGGSSSDTGPGAPSPFADAPVAAQPSDGSGTGQTPNSFDPTQLKKPPVDPQQFKTDKLPKPMPKLPAGLLQPIEPVEPAQPKESAVVQQLPPPITNSKPAQGFEQKPGAVLGSSAAIEAAKKKARQPKSPPIQGPKI